MKSLSLCTVDLKQIYYINQLHAVSRTQQGRQREPSVKTLRSPLSTEFELQNSTPRLASTPERKNENINLSKYFYLLEWRSNPQLVDFTTVNFVPLHHDWPLYVKIYTLSFLTLQNNYNVITYLSQVPVTLLKFTGT